MKHTFPNITHKGRKKASKNIPVYAMLVKTIDELSRARNTKSQTLTLKPLRFFVTWCLCGKIPWLSLCFFLLLAFPFVGKAQSGENLELNHTLTDDEVKQAYETIRLKDGFSTVDHDFRAYISPKAENPGSEYTGVESFTAQNSMNYIYSRSPRIPTDNFSKIEHSCDIQEQI